MICRWTTCASPGYWALISTSQLGTYSGIRRARKVRKTARMMAPWKMPRRVNMLEEKRRCKLKKHRWHNRWTIMISVGQAYHLFINIHLNYFMDILRDHFSTIISSDLCASCRGGSSGSFYSLDVQWFLSQYYCFRGKFYIGKDFFDMDSANSNHINVTYPRHNFPRLLSLTSIISRNAFLSDSFRLLY